VAVTRLLAEIRELGYTGSANLLVRYLNQGRADAIRKPPSPRRLVSWLMGRPADRLAEHQQQLADLLASCAHLTSSPSACNSSPTCSPAAAVRTSKPG
jgi:hypothetical protein